MTGPATRALAVAELTLRVERETAHARKAMAALGRASHADRVRRPGRVERATSHHWRRAKRHMRAAAKARAMLAATLPVPAAQCEAHARAIADYCAGLSFGAALALAALAEGGAR